jgi:c-di-AMP phosphodiesterase-like protein
MTNIRPESSPTANKPSGLSPSADPAQKRSIYMKAQEFDQKFHDGENITEFLDVAKAKRFQPEQSAEQAIVSINLPIWLIELIDREADHLGVTPQSLIQNSLASQFASN